MEISSPDSRRILLWRALRRKIRQAAGQDRYRLLRGFSDEIRFITAMAVKATSAASGRDPEKCLELADILAVLAGGLMLVDPYNPGWPGRDRLVVGETEYMIAVCSALTIMGFFSSERVAGLVEAAEKGTAVAIPGLDYLPVADELTTASAWDIAVESRQRKATWRGGPEDRLLSGRDWADPVWKNSPAAWRTYVILKADTPEAARCRTLPVTASEQSAGLYVIVATPNREAADLATLWRDSGWDASAIGSGDRLRLYDALAEESPEKPRAIMLGIRAASAGAESGSPGGEAHLLGELSDEQFNSLMNEFFESIG